MRVLIIDSNSSYETVYRRKLLFLTTRIDFAPDIATAKKLITTRSYDIIFISHILKGMTGDSAIKTLYDTMFSGLIIILASGNHIEEISSKYERDKICGIINKGQNNEDFSTKVKDMLTTEKKCKLGVSNVSSRD